MLVLFFLGLMLSLTLRQPPTGEEGAKPGYREVLTQIAVIPGLAFLLLPFATNPWAACALFVMIPAVGALTKISLSWTFAALGAAILACAWASSVEEAHLNA